MERLYIAVCTDRCGDIIQQGAMMFEAQTGRHTELEWYARCEDLLYRLRETRYSAVIVDIGGAQGMEIAIGARGIDEAVPLVWISDDEGFALQSYRLRAKLFLVRPVDAQQITEALLRCAEPDPYGQAAGPQMFLAQSGFAVNKILKDGQGV
ncbi:hypothetical protein H8711_06350 [Clostridiaceae bacterium NSJ-31]|uniref:Response regulatory domain-containing protein n=1 Tax=Ligaoa zhengdingensis TaxID=2763658 RepID=A0A926DZY9_9FIRM|nr:hypothetical protein [Ligaoa zhengdingensis]MBC8546554.1 hypothetical protein [Ligaoa zhengdingensis]